MTLPRRTQLYLFLGLVAVLAAILIGDWGRSSERAAAFSLGGKYIALKVEDPRLRLDLLERARRVFGEYAGRVVNLATGFVKDALVRVPDIVNSAGIDCHDKNHAKHDYALAQAAPCRTRVERPW